MTASSSREDVVRVLKDIAVMSEWIVKASIITIFDFLLFLIGFIKRVSGTHSLLYLGLVGVRLLKVPKPIPLVVVVAHIVPLVVALGLKLTSKII